MPWYFWKPRRIVTLYGKPGCHLCEEAAALLAQLGRRYPMEVTEIDISQDSVLFRRYDIVIPVIAVMGRGEVQAPLDRRQLERLLKG